MAEPLRDEEDSALVDAQEAMQDALLLERVLRGDADAYGALVSRHMRRAFSIAWRILQHREDAEDVVQDSFIRALERIDQLEKGRPFRPWLMRIVVNQSLNYRRGRSVRATEAIPDSATANGAAPDRSAENAELREQLLAALHMLPEKQRLVVQLADLENMTSAEIGQVLDISDGTVRWHLHEARKTLRQTLARVREDT